MEVEQEPRGSALVRTRLNIAAVCPENQYRSAILQHRIGTKKPDEKLRNLWKSENGSVTYLVNCGFGQVETNCAAENSSQSLHKPVLLLVLCACEFATFRLGLKIFGVLLRLHCVYRGCRRLGLRHSQMVRSMKTHNS